MTTLLVLLQANVMLEYNLDDATELISRNIQLATSNMRQVDDDLDFLRYSLANCLQFFVLKQLLLIFIYY